MAIFVCPDIHELAMLNFVEKLKRPRKSIVNQTTVVQKIIGFLQSFSNDPNLSTSPSSSTSTTSHSSPTFFFVITEIQVSFLITALEELGFLIPLTTSDSLVNNVLSKGYLVPSLRPTGEFRWSYSSADPNVRTLGRRIERRDEKEFLPFWFCNLQVPNFASFSFFYQPSPPFFLAEFFLHVVKNFF